MKKFSLGLHFRAFGRYVYYILTSTNANSTTSRYFAKVQRFGLVRSVPKYNKIVEANKIFAVLFTPKNKYGKAFTEQRNPPTLVPYQRYPNNQTKTSPSHVGNVCCRFNIALIYSALRFSGSYLLGLLNLARCEAFTGSTIWCDPLLHGIDWKEIFISPVY